MVMISIQQTIYNQKGTIVQKRTTNLSYEIANNTTIVDAHSGSVSIKNPSDSHLQIIMYICLAYCIITARL